MKRRWKVHDGWAETLGWLYALGWIPAVIAAQWASRGHLGGHHNRMTPAAWVTLGGWFLPVLLVVFALVFRCAWKAGPPIRRVSEPVTTDLRETM